MVSPFIYHYTHGNAFYMQVFVKPLKGIENIKISIHSDSVKKKKSNIWFEIAVVKSCLYLILLWSIFFYWIDTKSELPKMLSLSRKDKTDSPVWLTCRIIHRHKHESPRVKGRQLFNIFHFQHLPFLERYRNIRLPFLICSSDGRYLAFKWC